MAVRLIIQDSIRPIAEIDGFNGPVPRIGETVFVPVGNEPFSEPKIVKDVQHEILAPRTRARLAGERLFRLAWRPTVRVQV